MYLYCIILRFEIMFYYVYIYIYTYCLYVCVFEREKEKNHCIFIYADLTQELALFFLFAVICQ